ncbi:WD repeat-containing protein 74 isoform X3 [Chironomus tepperi]|uniref:WD repeat-containing protein 74 isoform X3 n=1 Tax=Chironomus tepperi TaxID=113505 RepID=UPI00391F4567
MKYTTHNVKNGDYKENHVLYVGTQTGSFKRVDIFNEDNPYKQTNLQNLDAITKDSKVTALCWADDDKNEIILGRGDSVIRTFECDKNQFCETDLSIPEGKIVGLAWSQDTIVAASDTGKIHILNDAMDIIETGDNISKMRQCSSNRNLVAVGGKERKNNLKVFDLETKKQIFTSKNVPHDNLQLEVPVWDSDMSFVNNNDSCLVTCSRYGYIRFYDYRQQRRPIHNYTDSREQAFNSLTEKDGIIYVGTTTGSLYAFDLKSMKIPLHTYKGATGSISSITVDETGNYLFSSSLDRYVRVYDSKKTHLLYQCYVKSKASEILMRVADDRLLSEHKEASKQTVDVSDEEYETMFNKMQKVNDDASEPSSKKLKSIN